jgi:hypothetical protein
MFNNNVGLAIGKALAHTQKKVLGFRGDMYFADAIPLNRAEAKVMIGYDRNLGRPNLEQIGSFVTAKFNGDVDPKLASVMYHERGLQHAVTLATAMVSKRLPVEKAEEMTALSSTMFLDTQLQESWMIKADNGSEYLECVREEDISSVLKAARGKHVITASCNFSNIATGSVEYNTGDTVEFIADGILRAGVVKSKTDRKATVSSDDQSFCVDEQAVIKVLELSPKSAEAQRRVQYDFYKKVYGDKYARDLVKGQK